MKVLLVENEYFSEELSLRPAVPYGYSVECVYGGEDGLEYARTENYDLVIMECLLPGKSGIDVTRILRREHVHTPILLIMPGSSLDERLSGFEAGADDCLSRPFDMAEFTARAKALCRRKSVYVGEEIAVGDIVLSRTRREIVRGKNSVHLGGKEYEMMEMLVLNKNQIISKVKLADKIWGYDSDAEYNNIEVYISFLRRKLRSLGSSVEIRAVRGIGYCLKQK